MTRKLANIFVAFVALEHLGFLILEMFLWTTPTGRGVFGTTLEFAQQSSALAANQGLYNGFLAAGLVWGLMQKQDGYATKLFFLICIVIAAVFGAATAKFSILFVQGLPAAIGLLLLIASRRKT